VAPLQTPLGELTCAPQIPYLNLRGRIAAGRGRDEERELGMGTREEKRRGGGKGWRWEGEKVTEGMGRTGQDMG